MAQKLYDICLRRISRNLEHKSRNDPPFSSVPSNLIHDLIVHTLSLHAGGKGFRAAYLEPLLLSGRVTQLSLHDIRLEEELLPTLRSFTVCRGLRSLSLINICEFNVDIVSRLLEELLHALKNLEELHCSVLFGLSALRKCRKLKNLKLHFTPDSSLDDLLDEVDGNRQPHQNLEVITLCGKRSEKFVHFKEVRELLLHCPKLRSFGYIDVSAAFGSMEMEHKHSTPKHGSCANESDQPEHKFGLENCCWNIERISRHFGDVDFLSSIRVAALACPKLKELVIKIPQGHFHGALCVLRTLRNLTYLEIELEADCENGNFRPDVFCLLSEVGSSLRHLSLHKIDNIEFDTILNSCPQLVSLKTDCDQVAEIGAETTVNQWQLQRLAHFCLDGCSGIDSLRLVLCKCPNLQELFLKNCKFLTDSFLSRVLKDNPIALSQLKTVCFYDCSLTKEGVKNLLKSAKNLQRIFVESFEMDEEDTDNLIRKLNTAVTIIPEYDECFADEFFYRRRYLCSSYIF